MKLCLENVILKTRQMTDKVYLQNLRKPNKEHPLKVLVSACLTGIMCGYDGTANGKYPSVLKLLNRENLKLITFCPEEFSFGRKFSVHIIK
mgnify:CR=1 FL=1